MGSSGWLRTIKNRASQGWRLYGVGRQIGGLVNVLIWFFPAIPTYLMAVWMQIYDFPTPVFVTICIVVWVASFVPVLFYKQFKWQQKSNAELQGILKNDTNRLELQIQSISKSTDELRKVMLSQQRLVEIEKLIETRSYWNLENYRNPSARARFHTMVPVPVWAKDYDDHRERLHRNLKSKKNIQPEYRGRTEEERQDIFEVELFSKLEHLEEVKKRLITDSRFAERLHPQG